MGVPTTWGARAAEVARTYPCDVAADDRPVRLVRAVDVAAPATTTFAWLCQLRLAPYSYDLVDNRGRRSPRDRTVRVEDLGPGAPMMPSRSTRSCPAST